MRLLRERASGIDHRRLTAEAIGFLVVGALNFVLTLIVFYVLFKVMGLHYLVALGISWAVGLVFSYALNFAWVFKPEQKLAFRTRFGKYLAANVVSISLNMLVLDFLIRRSGYDPFYVQSALIPLIVLFNFGTAKFWSLKSSR